MQIPKHLEKGEFFKGIVKYAGGLSIINTKYIIVENGALLKIKNAAHVRCFPNNLTYSEFPKEFEVIAPIVAVQELRGNIPDSHIQWLSTYEYIEKHEKYIGKM